MSPFFRAEQAFQAWNFQKNSVLAGLLECAEEGQNTLIPDAVYVSGAYYTCVSGAFYACVFGAYYEMTV